MEYKFNVGDIVKVKTNGRGFAPDRIGEIYIITERGKYAIEPGYKAMDQKGNIHTNSYYDDFVGEDSFDPHDADFLVGKWFIPKMNDIEGSLCKTSTKYKIESVSRSTIRFKPKPTFTSTMGISFMNFFSECNIVDEPVEEPTSKSIHHWRNLNLEEWLRETKEMNYTESQLESHIGSPSTCNYTGIYQKLEGDGSWGKAKILYEKWNTQSIEPWSIGTYVVFVVNYGGHPKGTISKIEKNYSSYCTVEAKYEDRLHEGCNLNHEEECKWFATESEALAYSKHHFPPKIQPGSVVGYTQKEGISVHGTLSECVGVSTTSMGIAGKYHVLDEQEPIIINRVSKRSKIKVM